MEPGVQRCNTEKPIAIVAWLLIVPAFAAAQNTYNPARGQGYLFVGPIGANYIGAGPNWGVKINTGFGVEVLLYKGLGLGGEAEYARQGTIYQAVGIGSIDFAYHFIRKESRSEIEPFAIGGPSVYFGNGGSAGGFTLGGGVNWWLAKHVAVRFEIRDHAHIGNNEFPRVTSFVAFRFGVTFR